MWPALIVGIITLGAAAILLGLIPPPNAPIRIRIRAGRAELSKGRVRSDVLAAASDVLADGRVNRGFIAITSRDRVMFSANIPSAIRQRLRNVLLNRW
jgi:hypothetical protein